MDDRQAVRHQGAAGVADRRLARGVRVLRPAVAVELLPAAGRGGRVPRLEEALARVAGEVDAAQRLGVLALGEPAHRPKLVGVALMFAGLVLVALG